MKSKRTSVVIMTGVLVVLSGWAVTAQDKYTLRVPDGLAFSEFKGYETWQYGLFDYDTASDRFTPDGKGASRGFARHTPVKAKDYVFTAFGRR